MSEIDAQTLLAFQSAEFTNDRYSKVQLLFEDPEAKAQLDESAIKFASPVAASLFNWIKGQLNIYRLSLKLEPKRQNLREANEELELFHLQYQ